MYMYMSKQRESRDGQNLGLSAKLRLRETREGTVFIEWMADVYICTGVGDASLYGVIDGCVYVLVFREWVTC